MPSPDDTDPSKVMPSDEQVAAVTPFEGLTTGSRYSNAQQALEAAETDAVTKFLAPFAEAFAALHAVTLEDVPTTEAVPELDQVDPQVLETASTAVETLIVLGGTAGVMSAAAILGVRSLSTAPNLVAAVTKAVPPKMSRSLADYATRGVELTRSAGPKIAASGKLLFDQTRRGISQNRGSVAAVAGLAAAGLVGWAMWADKAERDSKQAEQLRQLELDAANARNAQLADELVEERLLFVTERAEEATEVLNRLTDVGLARLSALRELVNDNDDYTTYTADERYLVGELSGLATAAAAVIASQQHILTAAEPPGSRLSGEPGPHPNDEQTLQVARTVLDRYTHLRTPGPVAASVSAWSAATRNTTTQRDQLAYLLDQPAYLEKLATRCGNTHSGIQNGFHFEWKHEMSFNLDAIRKDSDLRADLTERLGDPHAAADLVVRTPTGDTVRSVQAKVVASNSQRIGPKNGMTDPKYSGMDLLIPTDHVALTEEFMARVLERPAENIKTAAYLDARERMTDTVTVDGISSDPVSTDEMRAITDNPGRHVQDLVSKTRRDQAFAAGLAAAGPAALLSIATGTTNHLLDEGHLDGYDWAQATVSAARTGAASAVAAGAGTYLQSGAQVALADGAGGWVQESLAHGDHGVALTQAAVDIAAIVHALATKQLTPAEAAKSAAVTIVESGAIWICTAVARKTIPDAEAAALVGPLVGQAAAQLLLQGLQIAVLARDPAMNLNATYDALIADAAALELVYTVEREELAALAQQFRSRYTEDVLPALGRLGTNSEADDGSADVLADLAAIADYFAGAPLFLDLDEFDAFMADPTTTLLLDLGHSGVRQQGVMDV